MQLTDLQTDTRFLTNTTSDDFSDADLKRSLNRHYDSFVTFIWNNQGEWRFDDSNKSTFAIAKKPLVGGQQDYIMPTDAREIHRVAVKDSGGDYSRLNRLHEEDVGYSLQEFYEETGMPTYFALRGRSIILYPPPKADDVTLSEGLLVYVSRSVTELSNNTDEPGFDREFHRVLSLGASIDWCIASENLKKKQELNKELQSLMEYARQFYATRDKSQPDRIRPVKENYES